MDSTNIIGTLVSKNYAEFTIVNESGIVLSSFTGARIANKCMPFDTVSYNGDKCGVVRACYTPLHLAGTLLLSSKTRYGLTSRGVPLYLFQAEDPSYPPFIVGSSMKDTSVNIRVVIRYESWQDQLPRAVIVDNLGVAGSYNAETLVASMHASPLIHKLKDCTREKILSQSHIPCIPENAHVFNIDPPGCKDIDDIFAFYNVSDNHVHVDVIIAAAAVIIPPGSPIDAHANLRSATLYDAEGHVLTPLLPREISETLATLLPDGAYRPGVAWSCLIDITKECIIDDYGFSLVHVRNQKSYSYDSDFPVHISAILKTYTRILRNENPALKMLSVQEFDAANDAHAWVECAMIAYNVRMASWLEMHKCGILRSHKPADASRLETYGRLGGAELIHHALESAVYISHDAPDKYHAGLDAQSYTHATSPIRRYADLYNQQWFLHLTYPDIYPRPLSQFNTTFHNKRSKTLKTYTRTLNFLQCLCANNSKTVRAMIIDYSSEKSKIRLWIRAWNCVISWRHAPAEFLKTESIGVEVSLKYYINKNAPHWKDRFVLEHAV